MSYGPGGPGPRERIKCGSSFRRCIRAVAGESAGGGYLSKPGSPQRFYSRCPPTALGFRLNAPRLDRVLLRAFVHGRPQISGDGASQSQLIILLECQLLAQIFWELTARNLAVPP